MSHQLLTGFRRWWSVVLTIGATLALVWTILTPWNISNLSAHPNLVRSYAQAVERVDQLRERESSAMNPVCQLQFMSHGKKVERAIILVHGYTKCPQQFHELGQQFYDLGYNVLIVPLPHHGVADRIT